LKEGSSQDLHVGPRGRFAVIIIISWKEKGCNDGEKRKGRVEMLKVKNVRRSG